MARRRTQNLGVDWYLPDGKGGLRARRFATTTVADKLGIALLAEDGCTAAQALDRLPYASTEQKQVLEGFIGAGYGDVPLLDLGVRA